MNQFIKKKKAKFYFETFSVIMLIRFFLLFKECVFFIVNMHSFWTIYDQNVRPGYIILLGRVIWSCPYFHGQWFFLEIRVKCNWIIPLNFKIFGHPTHFHICTHLYLTLNFSFVTFINAIISESDAEKKKGNSILEITFVLLIFIIFK